MYQSLKAIGASTKEIRRLLISEVDDASDARGKTLPIQQQRAKQSFKKALFNGLMKEVEVDCPVCGEEKYEEFCSLDRIGLDVQSVMCSRCPTLYSRKRLDEPSLEVFYSQFYREMYTGSSVPTDNWFEEQVSSGRKILSQLIATGAIASDLRGVRVLEIGCGSGGILVPFAELGAEVVGIDFDDTYMEAGRKRGLNLIDRSIYEFQTEKKFHLIILKDVLEHLPNLNFVLQKLKSLLGDTGSVYIQVPTFEGLEFLGYKNDFLRYFQNAHIVHFSEASLNYLFERNGFIATHSNINGLAIFNHKVEDVNVLFDFEYQRKRSLERIARILNSRRKVALKEKVWKLLPKSVIQVYHGLQKRGAIR
jgi:2-polyprenyl-3-methyl-5-hydroxy-6-metoxy-1,4-benzoquinol methylase